jgi:hypothetical protein
MNDLPIDRLDGKAEQLHALGYTVTGRGSRPSANTQGLYLSISHELFDEQFLDQLIAGTPVDLVFQNRERFIRSI